MNALPPLCVALLLAAALPALAAEPDTVTLCPALNQSSALTKEFSNVEGLQAGKDGWLYANRDLKKAALPTAQTAAYLRRFTQQLEAQNTTLVLALLPSRLLLSARHWPDQHGLPGLERELRAAYQAKRTKLAESGALVPDLLTPLEAASRQPDAEDFYFSRDHHWTPAGARQTAQVLAPILNNLPALDPSPCYDLYHHA
jgi:alginate biosynthesis protein AlgX